MGVAVCVGVRVRAGVRVGVLVEVRVGVLVLMMVLVRLTPGVDVGGTVGVRLAHAERSIVTILIEVRTTNNFFVI